MYPLYGGKGIKCDFGSAVEIGFLYTRDHVDEMNDPYLARKKVNGNFSHKNCYFYDTKMTVKQLFKKVYGGLTNINNN